MSIPSRKAPSRRVFLRRLAAAPLILHAAAAAARMPTINVRDVGAFGNGKMSDLRAVREAIRQAAERSRGATVFFPPGDYFLGAADNAALITAAGLHNVRLVGERATISCRSVNGQSSMLLLAGCRNVLVEGLAFRDHGMDRDVNWLGAVALSIGNGPLAGSEGIEVRDCRFESVLGAVACIRPDGRSRCTDIVLKNLSINRSYYGLGFQDNGDNVTARDIRCDDVKRSYFPYGVSRHDIVLETRNNATGYTDVLVKCYRHETAGLRIRVKVRGKRGGDAIVALDNQHEKGYGVIRDIEVDLDVDDVDCKLDSVVLIRSFDPRANVETRTGNRWDRIAIDGEVRVCERTRLVEVATVSRTPGTMRIGRRLGGHPRLPQRLPGFETSIVR